MLRLLLVALVVPAAVLYDLDPLAVGVLVAGLPLSTILAAGVQVLIGRGFRLRVYEVELLVAKRTLASLTVAGAFVSVGANPFGDARILAEPPVGRGWRLRSAMPAVSGPLLLVALAAALTASVGLEHPVVVGAAGAAVVNAVWSLIPSRHSVAYLPSAGLALWRLPRGDPPTPAQAQAVTTLAELRRLRRHGEPERAEQLLEEFGGAVDDFGLAAALATLRFAADEPEAERARAHTLLSNPKLAECPAATRSVLYNIVAWADLLIGGPELVDEAERYAYQALEADPTAAVNDTLGWVALVRGTYEEAYWRFAQAYADLPEGWARSIVARGLALACQGGGDGEASAAWHRIADANGNGQTPTVEIVTPREGSAGPRHRRTPMDDAAIAVHPPG